MITQLKVYTIPAEKSKEAQPSWLPSNTYPLVTPLPTLDALMPSSYTVETKSGRGSVWSERAVRGREVAGSNPAAPTMPNSPPHSEGEALLAAN